MPDLVEDSPWLDIVPPSMAGVGRDGWLLRPVPYNGGGVLPDWVMHQPQRPRVAVILGTIVPRMGGCRRRGADRGARGGAPRRLRHDVRRVDAGVPQLLLPSGAEDRHINTAAVLDRGAGLACAPEQIDTTVLQRLITDDSARATTAEVR